MTATLPHLGLIGLGIMGRPMGRNLLRAGYRLTVHDIDRDAVTELAGEGVVGRPAPTHYSTMGYVLDPEELIGTTAPAIAGRMRAEGVDAAVLVPG